jgi:hypothetical protein
MMSTLQSLYPHLVPSIAKPHSFSPTRQPYLPHVERKAMPSLKFLPSIRDSETIICRRCKTGQYPRHGTCVVCRSPLEREYAILQIDALLNSELNVSKEHLAQVTGTLLRRLRKRRGICQSQLAMRSGGCITRTSLSKAECGRMLLPLYKLLPLARALGLTAVILRFDGSRTSAAHQSPKRR